MCRINERKKGQIRLYCLLTSHIIKSTHKMTRATRSMSDDSFLSVFRMVSTQNMWIHLVSILLIVLSYSL